LGKIKILQPQKTLYFLRLWRGLWRISSRRKVKVMSLLATHVLECNGMVNELSQRLSRWTGRLVTRNVLEILIFESIERHFDPKTISCHLNVSRLETTWQLDHFTLFCGCLCHSNREHFSVCILV